MTRSRSAAMTAGLVMIASLLDAVPAPAVAPSDASAREHPVAGQPLPVVPAGEDAERGPAPVAAAPVWPVARTFSLDVSRTPVRRPGLPVTVASVGPESPEKVTAELLDPGQAERLGGIGVAVRITGTKRGPIDLSLEYQGFRHSFGGNFADRLRLAKLPGPTVVPGSNDTRAGAISARVDTPATYLLVTAASGDAGDYRATDLKPSGKWAVGQASGSFSYSHPLTLPVPPYGSAPDLDLRYSSGSVDGRTSASNNQASWVGLGWDLNPGFIERRYRNCTDDGQTLLSDLCWHSPYSGDEDGAAYVLSLNGVTTELLRAADGSYRMRDDQGWRLDHRYDGQNSDNTDEYWVVSTPDGSRFRFGYRDDANLTVPVVGDDAGEPCNGSGHCRQTWRWSLDQILDPNDNQTNLYWTKETNYYKRWNNGDKLSYDRGGYLDRVDYGMRGTERATVQVDFGTGNRCASDIGIPNPDCAAPTSSSGEGEYPDVPRDLICTSGQECTKYTPSFFVVRRLTAIVTKVWDPPTSTYLEVNRYQPTYAFVNPTGPTDPMLWLNHVQTTGKFGDPVTLPVVDFDGSWLNNRVDYPAGDTVKAMPFRRLTLIRNGLGGQTRITYGHASAAATCPSNGSDSTWESGKKWDTNDQECYRQEFKPEGASKTKGVFHKYVTTKVEELDMVGGSPTQTTTYDYLDKAAWHHDDELVTPSDQQTWTDWRGYPTVRVTEGTGPNEQRTITESTYFRGLHGDKLSSGTRTVTMSAYAGGQVEDHHAKAGKLLQERSFRLNPDGSRTELRSSRLTYWDSGITANGPGLHNAHMIRTAETFARELRANGAWQESSTREDGHSVANGGLPTRRADWGETGSLDDLCTEIRYAQNTSGGEWLLEHEEIEELHTGPPDAQSGECPGQVVSRAVTLYDGATAPGPAANRPTSGNPTEVRKYTDDTSFTRERKSYDLYGRVISETDPVNATTTTAYNPTSGWPINGVITTDPLQHSTTEYISRAWGTTAKEVDPNGKVVSQDYDGVGRLQRVWLQTEPKPTGPEVPPPLGAVPSHEFVYRTEFSGTGQPTKPTVVISKQLQTLSGTPEFLTLYSLLDGQGRTREVQTASPSTEGGRTVVVTTYDDRGLQKGTSRPIWSTGGPGLMLNPATASIPSWTEKSYDALERETTATLFATGQVKTVSRTANYGDGKVVTPPRGGRTAFWNDVRDRLVMVQENVPAGTDVPPAGVPTTRYTYTPHGELALIVDAAGNRTEYTVDWLGRRLEAKDPDAGRSSTVYDPAGRTVSTTDAAGTKVSYSYDPLGRKRIEWLGDVGETKVAEWTFDSLPGAKGRPVAETRYIPGGGAYTVSVTGYDPRYRVTGRTWTIPEAETGLAGSYHYGYAYDRADHRVSIGYPAAGGLPAETVTTTYGATGLPTRLAGAQVYVDALTYHGSGQIKERTFGPVKRRYGFEPTGAQRLATIETLVDGAQVQHDTYGYDAADNVTSVTDHKVAQSQCYGYDALERLITSWTATAACPGGADQLGPDPYNIRYGYDLVGNLTSLDNNGAARTYSYPPSGSGAVRPHAVSSVGTDSFGYDARGQLTSRTVAGRNSTLAWDEQGRLASVSTGGTSSTFVYGADGNRLIRRDPGGSTLYLEDMEISSTGDATRYYTHGQALVAARSNTLTWIGNDVQGSVQIAVDGVTKVVSRQRYLPFGAHRGDRDDITTTDRGFVGKVEDPSGLVQMGARYYDPVIGKFISTDPRYDINRPQTLNPYSYAAGNPTTYSDPTGLGPCGPGEPPSCSNNWARHRARYDTVSPRRHYNWRYRYNYRYVPPTPRVPGRHPGHCVGIECTHSFDPPLPKPVVIKPKPAPKTAPKAAPKTSCTVTPNNNGTYPAAQKAGDCGSTWGVRVKFRQDWKPRGLMKIAKGCWNAPLSLGCILAPDKLLAPVYITGWGITLGATMVFGGGLCTATTGIVWACGTVAALGVTVTGLGFKGGWEAFESIYLGKEGPAPIEFELD